MSVVTTTVRPASSPAGDLEAITVSTLIVYLLFSTLYWRAYRRASCPAVPLSLSCRSLLSSSDRNSAAARQRPGSSERARSMLTNPLLINAGAAMGRARPCARDELDASIFRRDDETVRRARQRRRARRRCAIRHRRIRGKQHGVYNFSATEPKNFRKFEAAKQTQNASRTLAESDAFPSGSTRSVCGSHSGATGPGRIVKSEASPRRSSTLELRL